MTNKRRILSSTEFQGQRFSFPRNSRPTKTKGDRLVSSADVAARSGWTSSILWDILLPWMDYFACHVFCSLCQHKGQRANVLIASPYQNWKDAQADLTNHTTLQYHLDSKEKMDTFLQTMEKPGCRVDQILSQDARQTVERNRRFLESIIRCLELCGRQGIALWGHRDDGTPLEDAEGSTNMGNFKSLITLVSRTDEDLKMHLQTCPKTATYISKTTQNDLLQCIADFIQGKIVQEVKGQAAGSYYAVIADEVTDISNWEHLGIVLRYVRNNAPVERLLGYVNCAGITGEEIAERIIHFLSQVGLDTDRCRCQTYDGAGNMAGKQKGAAIQFQLKIGNTKATYFHCASHQLNLALSKASKVPEIHKVVCLMQTVGVFFKFSPKRLRALKRCIERV